MAQQLIESMSGKWRPKDYRDSYTERVQDLIDAKRNDRENAVADEAPKPTNVIDLMEALQRSIDSAHSGRTRAGKAQQEKIRATKEGPAKKAGATKTADKDRHKRGNRAENKKTTFRRAKGHRDRRLWRHRCGPRTRYSWEQRRPAAGQHPLGDPGTGTTLASAGSTAGCLLVNGPCFARLTRGYPASIEQTIPVPMAITFLVTYVPARNSGSPFYSGSNP